MARILSVAMIAMFLGTTLLAQVDDPGSPGDTDINGTNPPAEDEGEVAEEAAKTDEQASQAAPAEQATPRELVYVLGNEVYRLQRQVEQLQQEVRRLQQQIADFQPGSTQDFLGAMGTDEILRKSVGSAAQGRINIENYTGEEVLIYINGTRWRALKNHSYVYAPVGTVTFQEMQEAEPTFFNEDQWEFKDGMLQITYRIYKD
jgi:hypothetical protein